MYYNAAETAIYGPGPYIGRATSKELTGPWERMDAPVLTRGHRSEWDNGYVIPSSILKKQDGTFILWYTGGAVFTDRPASYIGMATSTDGKTWSKYNDPATKEHPLADSDPVLSPKNQRNLDNYFPWSANVYKTSNGFEMYYSGLFINDKTGKGEIEFASSRDGIHWDKYPQNPVFGLSDNPSANDHCLEFPSLVRFDSVYFLYYDYFDYGLLQGNIAMAVAKR